MKNLLSTAALVVAFSASAALADSNQMFVEQLGDGHLNEAQQSGLFNYNFVFQNGYGEISKTAQTGQNNYLNFSQGKVNPAGNPGDPRAHETSSSGNFLSSIQNGDSNTVVGTMVGVNNQAFFTQSGNSNAATTIVNENTSYLQVQQTGYLNVATTKQGI